MPIVPAYQHGRLVNGKRYAYRGLNGRMSAVEEHLDWTGAGTWTDSPGQPVVFGAPEFQRSGILEG